MDMRNDSPSPAVGHISRDTDRTGLAARDLPSSGGRAVERVQDAITAKIERKLLTWLCERLPGWVTSDMLTALGVLGAAISFVGYWQSWRGTAFLWLACAGIVLNWFGDSLDGSLARLRHAERPKYGFFLDHMSDTLAMGLIALGAGLSPYISFASGMAVLLGYYAMVILAMTTSQATGVFRISFNGLGPTEIRLFIIACTLCTIVFPTPRFTWLDWELTIYDALLVGVTLLLIVLCVRETMRTLHVLTIQDPPRR
jgi:phosphatidylglycerophosphate synthase